MADEPIINVDDDELSGLDSPTESPGLFGRLFARLLRPLVPLGNKSLRLRYEVENARHAEELAKAKRDLQKAKIEADAAKQEKDTMALMHARIVAMLQKEIAIHNANAKRATGE